jgi:ubiquinone biosynthesis protein UbiJ
MGFIDDLIQGFDKEINNIKERSQTMVKAYNFSQELRELERQKKDLLVAIGKAIYAKYSQEIVPDEETLKRKCEEIAVLEKDIAYLQKQLEDLKVNTNSSAKEKPM